MSKTDFKKLKEEGYLLFIFTYVESKYFIFYIFLRFVTAFKDFTQCSDLFSGETMVRFIY